jgi:hypothetical protein
LSSQQHLSKEKVMTRLFLPLVGLACAGLLTACGGGSDAEPVVVVPPVTDAIPDTASQNSMGLVTYLTALSTAAADDKDPLDLSKFTPAQPDDTEPETLK